MPLQSFGQDLNVAVIGASGGIGRELVDQLAEDSSVSKILALSRSSVVFGQPCVETGKLDLNDPESIHAAIDYARSSAPFDLVIVASGLLHSETVQPERSLHHLNFEVMSEVFATNTIGPALLMAGFLPLMRRGSKSVVAAISARVGSISDNRLGGWISYRASKAALNMVVRTLSIEQRRTKPYGVVIALQPGTVDTPLSAPFNSSVPPDKLFTPEFCAQKLLGVIDRVEPSDSGGFFSWDGSSIDF